MSITGAARLPLPIQSTVCVCAKNMSITGAARLPLPIQSTVRQVVCIGHVLIRQNSDDSFDDPDDSQKNGECDHGRWKV